METILYEQAANELVRISLRLEHCHEQLDYYLNNPAQWDSRQALGALVDLLQVLDRPDLKSKLAGECSRLIDTFAKVQSLPNIDAKKLQTVIRELQTSLSYLNQLSGKFASTLRENYFIEHVKQLMQGGSCPLDSPPYYYWLNLSPENRIHYLTQWREQLAPIHKIIKLYLRLIRHSQLPNVVNAEAGFFQLSFDSKQQNNVQLIRVGIPEKYACYPEISIGKHRLCIRFLSLNFKDKPTVFEKDLQIALTSCLL